MPDFAPQSDPPSSTTRTIQSFYERIQEPDLDRWADLWSQDGTYLNPFATSPFPRKRVAGIDQIVEVIGAMRDAFDVLEIVGRKVEPALAPEIAPIVVYVSGDWRFATSHTKQIRTSHFHHRLEIDDGKIAGWVDYTNPLTRSPSLQSEPAAPSRTPASASHGGDGRLDRSETDVDRLEIAPKSCASVSPPVGSLSS
jgi:ketosteroid isomerase-like protein